MKKKSFILFFFKLISSLFQLSFRKRKTVAIVTLRFSALRTDLGS